MAPGNLSRLGLRLSCANNPILRNCSSVSWTSLLRPSSSALGINCLAMVELASPHWTDGKRLLLMNGLEDCLLSGKNFLGSVMILMALGTIGACSDLRIMALLAILDLGHQDIL